MSAQKVFTFDWSFLGLIEFILSRYNANSEYKYSVLDIGSGAGSHSDLLQEFGYRVQSLDKYAENSDIKEDFLSYDFTDNFDVIFCSHVIEHQRNVGHFLDKIYDTLEDDGELILSAPKHPPERLVEGHLSVYPWPLLLQNLIYAGFDCKSGKIINSFETTFIVRKSSSFTMSEREESGFKWSEQHQGRSPVKLQSGASFNCDINSLYNCECLEMRKGREKHKQLAISYKPGYMQRNVLVKSDRFGLRVTL